MLGDAFDIKEFYNSFPKILNEFQKRISSDITFYYWTGKKNRFQDFPLQSFNKNLQNKQDRFDIVKQSRRGDPGVFCAPRASLPIHNATTVRTKFHKFQETLPQPPDPNESI